MSEIILNKIRLGYSRVIAVENNTGRYMVGDTAVIHGTRHVSSELVLCIKLDRTDRQYTSEFDVWADHFRFDHQQATQEQQQALEQAIRQLTC
jgi:hypothetical protein